MQQQDWKNINDDFEVLIDEYVQKQDLHALETPLKTAEQLKKELREKLIKQNKFETLSLEIFEAIDLINGYLETNVYQEQKEKVRAEMVHAFKVLEENSVEKTADVTTRWELNPDQSLWTDLYGISDETLLLIYDMVLNCYQKDEIENAKNLLCFLLIFAPILPTYWNALGLCYQTAGEHEQALKYLSIAEELDPEALQTHFYLARCYLAMNQKFAAQEQLEKILKQIDSLDDESGPWRQRADLLAQELLN